MSFHKEIKGYSLEDFVPSWPSVVMGTGILPIALLLGSSLIPFFKPLASIFFGLTMLFLSGIFLLWVLRIFRFPRTILKELKHPVAGSFFPTMPIAFMIAAIDWMLLGPSLTTPVFSLKMAQVFFWIGTIGIYLFSWIIMPALFHNTGVEAGHSTFGWYIPPVSHLIIPVVGLELIHKMQGSGFVEPVFYLSLFSLGIGFFLFIFIGANIFYRYLYRSTPVGKMAPTLFIGMAPTAILTIILVKLNVAVSSFPWEGIEPFPGTVKILGTLLWGFSFWWFVLALLKTGYALAKKTLSFQLSWWAFTFPIGALAVAAGALNKLLGTIFMEYLEVGLTIFLLLVWGYVFVKTIIGIANRSIFEE